MRRVENPGTGQMFRSKNYGFTFEMAEIRARRAATEMGLQATANDEIRDFHLPDMNGYDPGIPHFDGSKTRDRRGEYEA